MLWGVFNLIMGSFFLWLGAFQLITAMLPHDFAMKVAEKHGAWMRENIFHLPSTLQQKEPSQ